VFILSVFLLGHSTANNLRATGAVTNERRLKKSGESSSEPADPNPECVSGVDKIRYKYTFVGGCVLEGYASDVNILLNWCDDSYGPIDLHVSCSDDYVDGYSTKGHGPQPGEHPPVDKYFIQKLNSDCTLKENCDKSTDLDFYSASEDDGGDKEDACTSNDNSDPCSDASK